MNEYVETARKVITDTAGKVAETSNNLYNTARLSLKISKLKTNINECYRKMGEICYKNYQGKETSEEDAENLCVQIDKINERIARLSAEIAELKGCAVCENCGAEIQKDSSYCAKCGAEV